MNAITDITAPRRNRQHFTGLILATIRQACRATEVKVHHGQQNGSYGVHQALVKLDSDPTDYRLILAPANAPITINGRPIDEHFAKELNDVV
jgi:hypothetical protein